TLARLTADGRATSAEWYDLSDFATALDRFDELFREEASERAGNAAWRAARAARDATNARDWDGFCALLSESFASVDERAGLGRMQLRGDDAMETHRVLFALDDFFLDRELVATRGDRLALTQETVTFVDGLAGRSEIATLTVCEVDEAG